MQDLGTLLGDAPLALSKVRVLLTNLARSLQGLHETGQLWDQSESSVEVTDDYIVNRIGTVSERESRLGPGQIDASRDFASPEYIESATEDERSDIWVWGNVAFEAVSGKRPFTGHSVHEIITTVLKSEAEAACGVNAQCPEELSAIIGRALKKNPSERWQSAYELLKALETISW